MIAVLAVENGLTGWIERTGSWIECSGALRQSVEL